MNETKWTGRALVFEALRDHYWYAKHGQPGRCACGWTKAANDAANEGHAGHLADVISAVYRVEVQP